MRNRMIICKCCGGENEVPSGVLSKKCCHCGVMESFPGFQDESIIDAINMANRYRIEGKFTEATDIYTHLLEKEEAGELYLGRLLSRYGIRFFKRTDMMEATATCDLPVPISVPDAQVGKDGLIWHDSDYIHAQSPDKKSARLLYTINIMKVGRAQKRALGIPCAFPEELIHKEPTENE